MSLIHLSIRQPVTITVGVILVLLAGLIALDRIPIQLTPDVDETVITITTNWEGASPQEIEQEIVHEQEDALQGVANLVSMTSESRQGSARIRLQFAVGVPIEKALREVSDKLRQVPDYPENADEPVVELSDFMNRDFITWIVMGCDDPTLDIRTLQDFVDDRIKPVLQSVPGVSEVGVFGGREREVQIRFDPRALADRGITVTQLISAIRDTNANFSAGQVQEGKSDIRLRAVGQYDSIEGVRGTLVAHTPTGPVYLGDVAEVLETYKEQRAFVRSKGRPVIAINAQREPGTNVIAVLDGIDDALEGLNGPGGALEAEARRLGLSGRIYLEKVYDQTVYIDDALALVRNNIWLGGALAVIILLLFLRSLRVVGVIALAIPISVIGAVVAMLALGRSVNVVSLAGMAFAVGMVVDNAIVVLENVFRHLEMGKRPHVAAFDATREVWGAILASTLTTIVVFVPILLIEDEAGQLFRDIALAICAAVALSLLVAITVIPTASARMLKPHGSRPSRADRLAAIVFRPLALFGRLFTPIPAAVAWTVDRLISGRVGAWVLRPIIITLLTIGSIVLSMVLMPPIDYLPLGNRNLVFGGVILPSSYNMETTMALGDRIEPAIRPFWEAAEHPVGSQAYEAAKAALPKVPLFNPFTGKMDDPITPVPLSNYFLVSFEGMLFHGAVAAEPARAVDIIPLFNHATRSEILPDTFSFANQAPLFRMGGSSGSAVSVDFVSDSLDDASRAAQAIFLAFIGRMNEGFMAQPRPGNFNLPTPELQVIPDMRRLGEVGMTPRDLGLAVLAAGDGAIIGDYRLAGDTIDLKVIGKGAVEDPDLSALADIPIATPTGHTVALATLAELRRVPSVTQINHVGRQRAVSVEISAPPGLALEAAIAEIDEAIAEARASGNIAPTVSVSYTGSASKLREVQAALLGDGTILGLVTSSLFLALLVVYLLMAVLFQSFLQPMVILIAVPPATFGGFLALAAVHWWSNFDRYLPIQKLDVLTILGFVLLIGVVVNNAILLVHQTLNFMKGEAALSDGSTRAVPARQAIVESVRTRIRPIFMSTLTSLGGMAPLVFMPGSGSELYRGLGAVVLGGLLVSTLFTLILVPLLFSLVLDVQALLARALTGGEPALPAGVAAK